MEQVALLFEYFLGNPEGMPEPYSLLARERAAHRVVCDYIAGMTDGFLRKTVRHLNLSI
jgi:dGTPase